MSNNIYTAGLWSTGPYQVSGMPFISGNIDVSAAGPDGIKIEFPYVTSWIQIYNLDVTPVNIAFSKNGLQTNNFFQVTDAFRQGQGGRAKNFTGPMKLKVTEIWLSASEGINIDPALCRDVDIVAGLTYIPVKQVTAISPSGSNWSGSVGVG